MRPQFTWISKGECECVVDEALGLLERVGMRIGTSGCLDLLSAAGASVDDASGVARIPRDVVMNALAGCPRDVLLAGARPSEDCLLDGDSIHFAPSGSPTHVLDMDSGECRASTVVDQQRSTMVATAMAEVDIMWPMVTPTDVPDDQRLLTDYATLLTWSEKHVQHEITASWQVRPILEMIETVSGDLKEFRKRPRISIVCCTASPLAADGQFLDSCVALIAHGVPVLVYPMPIAGGTAPVTVAGTVALNVAEFLGVATIVRLACPDAPVIMGAGASLLDMKATTFSFGALETALMVAACAEVAHYLGVPVLCPGLATDAKSIGVQAGYEKALKGLVAASAGADLITGGIGLLGGANLLSLPQIVIDSEIAAMIKRILGGADMSRESIMADVIERVGFFGSYLREKETSRRLRAGEHFFPVISTRLSIEAWHAAGRDEELVAGEKVREIVAAAEERGPVVDDDQLASLRRIVGRASDYARAGAAPPSVSGRG